MFTFQWPWLIALLPLPLLVWKFWPRPQLPSNNLPQLRLPTTKHVQKAFSQFDSPQQSSQRWHWLLLILCWIGLVIALMYPQWLDKHIEVSQTGYDLMLAVDLSGSMETPDFFTNRQQIQRIDAVKLVLEPFLNNRVGDRIGLILFADQAYLQAPLTLDNVAVNSLLQKAIIGMAGRGRTAVGDAIGLAVKKLRERPEGSRILILLTDGDNNAGTLDPLKAAQLAKQYDIRIYTIGVGSNRGLFRQRLNEKPLKQIAKMTGGVYFPATDLSALANVYKNIDQTLTKTEAESRIYIQRTPLYQWPLGVAMFALLMLQLLRIVTPRY